MTSPAAGVRGLRDYVVIVLGLVCALGGLATAIMLGGVIAHLLKAGSGEALAGSFSRVLLALVWLAGALSVLVAGVSLVASGLARKRRDLVPGPTLYVLGAALVVNGMFLAVGGRPGAALPMLGAGAALLYLEGRTEIA